MKKTLQFAFFSAFLIFSGTALVSCKNGNNDTGVSTDLVTKSDAAMMTFDRTEHDFGSISAGTKVSYSFNFTNTGKIPLVISEAHSSCGCTVPTYPHDPIQPGQSGTIEVTFDSTGKTGHQKKTVTIISNTKPAENYVYITADIKS